MVHAYNSSYTEGGDRKNDIGAAQTKKLVRLNIKV
jgi:hypothetical protein